MRGLTLGTVLKAALLAGLAAGLTVAIFHFFATEPVLERAIAMEDQKHLMAGMPEEEPIVSREGQRVGLFIGFLIFGLVWALLFTVVYHLVQRRLPAETRGRALLALAGWWSVSLVPFLKYPANPPGVGDPDTIGYRQALYFSFLLLSVAGTTLALLLGRYLRATSTAGWRRTLVAPAFLLLFDLLIFAVIPSNPDAIGMPLALISTFRALSLAGLTLFWLAFGALFAWLLRAPSGDRAVLRPHTAGG